MNFVKNYLKIFILILIGFFNSNINAADIKPYYNVLDYGAEADGKTLDTESIQKAVDDCYNNGGGTVGFPAGTYLTGTIFLKDNVILDLQVGSTILGSKNIEDYPFYINMNGKKEYSALIQGKGLKNIGITGFGKIDGQGKSYQGKKDKRPFLLRFIGCEDITVEGITLQHSAAWTQHYLKCDGVTIRDQKIFAHGSENNDMVDIDQSRNVIITGLIGDSDDDGITLKSLGNGIVENVVISDCIIRTRTNAIKAGTESYGGFRDITITNCNIGPSETEDGFSGADIGLAGVALEIVDGGLMENVVISNLTIEETTSPIFIRLGNRARQYGNLNRQPIGSINNISISNIIARNASKTGCSIVGEIDHPITNVSISNVKINYVGGGTIEESMEEKPELINEYPECIRLGILPAYGFFVRHVDGITFRDVQLSYDQDEHRPAILFNDVQNLKLLNLDAEIADDAFGQVVLQNSSDVFINGCSPQISKRFVTVERNSKDINIVGNNFSNVNNPVSIDESIKTNDLNVSNNLAGKSNLFELLQPNIERDSLGMVSIYFPNQEDIYYTTDGTRPTKSSQKYTKAFKQIDPTIIKAVAINKKGTSSIGGLKLDRLAVLPPRIFPVDQFFNNKIKVKTISNTEDADIYYTFDGTIPNESSLKYNEPFDINEKSDLRAIAVKEDYINSKISSSKYETIEMSDKIQYKYYEGRWAVLPNFINMTPKRIGTTDKFSLEGLEYSELYFGFVMHGYVSIENAGNYAFYTATNDGSKLLVDNVEIIDNDGAHGTIEKSGKVYLEKGKHLIELRYFQAGGGKAMKVFWKGPNFEKREMTKEDLSGN